MRIHSRIQSKFNIYFSRDNQRGKVNTSVKLLFMYIYLKSRVFLYSFRLFKKQLFIFICSLWFVFSGLFIAQQNIHGYQRIQWEVSFYELPRESRVPSNYCSGDVPDSKYPCLAITLPQCSQKVKMEHIPCAAALKSLHWFQIILIIGETQNVRKHTMFSFPFRYHDQ